MSCPVCKNETATYVGHLGLNSHMVRCRACGWDYTTTWEDDAPGEDEEHGYSNHDPDRERFCAD